MVLIFSIAHSQSLFDEFEYYRVSTNYNGVAYNGQSILIYGEGGVITVSRDGGNNWTQESLDDKFNIMSITNVGNDYYGVINKQYVIKSSDNGANWQNYDYGNNTEFYKIIAYKNHLYALTNLKILKIDLNLNIINEYKIESDTNYYDFAIGQDKIVYSAGRGKLGLINLLNDNKNIIDFEKLGICSNCPVPKSLFYDNNIFYFTYFTELYQYDGNSISQVYKPIKSGPYIANNGEIFQLYNTYNPIEGVDSLYFVKINKQSKKSSNIKKPGNDRYIRNLVFKGISFITKDTIIAFGKNNLIYFSYDRGVNWTLKSYFPGHPFLYRFDDKNAAFIGEYGQFVSTKNGGITWLPQKNHHPLFNNNRFTNLLKRTELFTDHNNGFVFGHSSVNADTNFLFTNDGCETVKLKNISEVTGYRNSEYLLSYYNKDKILFFHPSNHMGLWRFTVLFRLDRELNYIDRYLIDSAIVVYVNSSANGDIIAVALNLKEPIFLQNNIHFLNKYTSILRSTDNGENWQVIEKFNFPNHDYNHLFVSLVRDDIFMSYIYLGLDSISYLNTFKYNLTNNKLDSILTLQERSINFENFIGVGDKTYLYAYIYDGENKKIYFELWYNEDIINNPREWKNIAPKERFVPLSFGKSNDSLFYIRGYDSLYKSPTFWFAKTKSKKPLSVEKVETDNRIFLSTPYPNPSNDFIKVPIWWNSNEDINLIEVKIHNLLGQVISSGHDVELIKYNDYSGEIKCNTSSFSPGLYILNVRNGQANKSIPIIINK